MIPCILSGGSGTRLWPVSRESHPKQFAELLDESLLTKTIKRLLPLGSPWVVTTRSMKVLTERAFREQGLPTSQLIYEPAGRGTAAAIALLCRRLELEGRCAEVVGIFPADHLIENTEAFARAVRLAADAAAQGEVVTLGLLPHFAATGYGYLELAEKFDPKAPMAPRPALRFVEKPDAERARQYLQSGRHFWNAGIFVFRADRMMELLRRHAPEVAAPFASLAADLSNVDEVYARAKVDSIDYAVMEKLDRLLCIPCAHLGWSDVGSWDEISRLLGPASSRAVEVGASGNFVFSHQAGKAYALVGVEDLIVADTPDALLIARKGESERVKEAQQALAKAGVEAARYHPFEYRPWGHFEVLRDNALFKSKVIRVDPGQQLSLQSHAKRAEHWVIIKGRPEVVLDDRVLTPAPGEHVYIPIGAKHRMRNPTQEPVEFVEVQVGTYFGEDDIVRHSDDYSRN